jgi:hypothetical protein
MQEPANAGNVTPVTGGRCGPGGPPDSGPPARPRAELLGEVAQFESIFRLCYLRGPAGIIVALAEQIG